MTTLYQIRVTREKPTRQNPHKYAVWFDKLYGDRHGGVSSMDTHQEIRAKPRSVHESWKEYDAIVAREPDPINENTLDFYSEIPEITKADAMGIMTLTAFFGGA